MQRQREREREREAKREKERKDTHTYNCTKIPGKKIGKACFFYFLGFFPLF
jgi:hypothetical protein